MSFYGRHCFKCGADCYDDVKISGERYPYPRAKVGVLSMAMNLEWGEAEPRLLLCGGCSPPIRDALLQVAPWKTPPKGD